VVRLDRDRSRVGPGESGIGLFEPVR